MVRFYYRASVEEAEEIIRTKKIVAKRWGDRFNPNSGPYFSLTKTIPLNSWLNPHWPSQAGTVLMEFTTNLTPEGKYTTTTYSALVGAGEAGREGGRILTLEVGQTTEKVATIVAPQQNALQLKGVDNVQLLSRKAQGEIAKMTAEFADGYISIE